MRAPDRQTGTGAVASGGDGLWVADKDGQILCLRPLLADVDLRVRNGHGPGLPYRLAPDADTV